MKITLIRVAAVVVLLVVVGVYVFANVHGQDNPRLFEATTQSEVALLTWAEQTARCPTGSSHLGSLDYHLTPQFSHRGDCR